MRKLDESKIYVYMINDPQNLYKQSLCGYLGHIYGNIQEMVQEVGVLFGVQQFQQSCRRVAVETITTHLIHLLSAT